jgi:hypothetical protein
VRTNYVLIDYENVQPEALGVLEHEHFDVTVFVGASQTKISFDVASALQRMGSRGRYVRISGNGSNALDFHIAFYIGQLAAAEPRAFFHIISKDTGFDPLIAHLKSRGVLACRSRLVTEMPIVKSASVKTQPQRAEIVIAKLQQLGAAKPRTIKTLGSTVNSLFQKALSEQEVSELIAMLEHNGHISRNATKVAYTLPAEHV